MSGDNDFEKCLDFVLAQEGGYNVTQLDPGGPTNMGITLKVFLEWKGASASKGDLSNLTRQEAGEIYKTKFWIPCQCGALPRGLSLVVFDAAVNSGVRRSVMLLQSALKISVDGICGDDTLAAVKRSNTGEMIRGAIAARLEFLKSLSAWDAFGAGWAHRCARLEKEALAMLVKGE